MEETRGLNRGSYIWGRSVHNTRIERLWYDVTRGFGAKWKTFFLELEADHGLEPERPSHLWLLHHLFLEGLNADAHDWADSWNAHRLHISGERAASPRELFMFGMIRHGPRGIERVLEPVHEELADPEIAGYGIDWDVIDDPALVAHHNAHNPLPGGSNSTFGPISIPQQLSEVTCDPPLCPLRAEQVAMLNCHLAHHCRMGSRDMAVRRAIWIVALDFCTHMF
ncbi:hypothetical protein OH77DRAFT_1414363 [Trametes cingulata]|nr:hypothetical protein OH77DRAFT_1414363 [Trametes cingulata]